MAQDLSIEDPNEVYFITTRTIASKLWFINNKVLEKQILAFLAKYQLLFGVVIYGFILMGNHYHLVAKFPNSNRAVFLKAFNSIVAKLVASVVPTYEGGKLWARRARVQLLPTDPDVEHWTFYAALNPISSGLAEKNSEYPLYNSFIDATLEREQSFQLIDWADFNNRKRYNYNLQPIDCAKTYTLKFAKIPGYEKLVRKEYIKCILKKAEIRRKEIIKKHKMEGKGFLNKKALLAIKPGSKPKSTKASTRNTKRPLVLTLCLKAKKFYLDKYFKILAAFKDASKRYRAGDRLAEFPAGTYKPIIFSNPIFT